MKELNSLGTKNHRLRKNESSAVPREIIFYDTEATYTMIDEQTKKFDFKVGVACYCRRRGKRLDWSEDWFVFHDIDSFWDWCISKVRQRTKIVLIAHNQHFDFTCLNGFVKLKERNFDNVFHVIDSQIFITKFQNGNKGLLALDLFNWFKLSVEAMGEYLGLPKLEVDFNTVNERELIKYCKRDVEIIKTMYLNWLRFIKSQNLGMFRYSTAGQAFGAFRHRFLQHQIFIHGNDEISKLERESYMGGRTETFRLGTIEEPIFALDFNSLYPSVMVNNEYPVKFIKKVKGASIDWLKMVIDQYALVARVYVNVNEPSTPKKEKRLIFPIGRFWTTLCTPEIKYLLERDAIIAYKDICLYEKAPVFTKYVTTLYDLRSQFKQENNLVYDLLTKLLMNSLYGKFGQLQRETTKIGDCDPSQIWVRDIVVHGTGERLKEYAFGGNIWIQRSTNKEWKHAFPAICAHVTSFGRVRLLEAIRKANWENVIYCDTDSVFVNSQGFSNLKSIINETELGALKLEKETNKVTIHGLKDYEFGDKIKRKGITKKAIQLEENKFEQEQWLKIKSLLRAGNLNSPIIKIIEKTLKREYKKGEVLENGYVIPFEYSEPLH